MNAQPDLFDSREHEPPASDGDTSADAAREIEPLANRLRAWVFVAIRNSKAGATCEELCDRLNLAGNTVRPRLWELENRGLIEKTDAKRRTRSGRWARVYRTREDG